VKQGVCPAGRASRVSARRPTYFSWQCQEK
jgi:hypothetical protein